MQGRAIDVVLPSMAMFNSIKRLFPNATELIYTPAGRAQLRNGRPSNGGSSRVKAQHYNHVHLAMANGGVWPGLYDNGGILPHGGMGVNLSGKPERVLNPEQTREWERRGLRPGDRLRLVVDGHEFNAYADGRVDAALDGVSNTALLVRRRPVDAADTRMKNPASPPTANAYRPACLKSPAPTMIGLSLGPP
jgi:hypothetical protein